MKNNKQKKAIIITISVILLLIVFLILFIIFNILYPNVSENTDIYKKSDADYDTTFNFYILTSINSKNLSKVSFERYFKDGENWIKENNNSPLFESTGEAKYKRSALNKNEILGYYIPIYELNDGITKIIIKEDYNDGTSKNIERTIEKVKSEFDEQYRIKPVSKTSNLSLDTYQEEMNVNMNDYRNIVLTGSFYSPSNDINISVKWYSHPGTIPAEIINDEKKKEEHLQSWEEVTPSFNNNTFNLEENANIYGNYWTVNLFNVSTMGNKIELTATNSLGEKVVKNVYINNYKTTSNPEINEYSNDMINKDGSIGNKILLYFLDTKQARCEEIISEIGGNVIGNDHTLNDYVVVFNDKKFNTLQQGTEFCNKISEKYDEILYATPNMIMQRTFNLE